MCNSIHRFYLHCLAIQAVLIHLGTTFLTNRNREYSRYTYQENLLHTRLLTLRLMIIGIKMPQVK